MQQECFVKDRRTKTRSQQLEGAFFCKKTLAAANQSWHLTQGAFVIQLLPRSQPAHRYLTCEAASLQPGAQHETSDRGGVRAALLLLSAASGSRPVDMPRAEAAPRLPLGVTLDERSGELWVSGFGTGSGSL